MQIKFLFGKQCNYFLWLRKKILCHTVCTFCFPLGNKNKLVQHKEQEYKMKLIVEENI
jgi:hypothetical protein